MLICQPRLIFLDTHTLNRGIQHELFRFRRKISTNFELQQDQPGQKNYDYPNVGHWEDYENEECIREYKIECIISMSLSQLHCPILILFYRTMFVNPSNRHCLRRQQQNFHYLKFQHWP